MSECPLAPTGPLVTALAVRLVRRRLQRFDEWNELYPLDTLSREELVHIQRLSTVDRVHDTEDVVFDIVFVEQGETVHGRLERGAVGPRLAKSVVELSGPVDTYPYEEIVLCEERTPLVIETCPVGLNRIFHPLLRVGVFLLELNDRPVEIETAERRFTTLPRERHHGSRLCLNVLTDELLQRLLRHVVRRSLRVQFLLVEIETVLALEIAGRPGRLRHHVKRT